MLEKADPMATIKLALEEVLEKEVSLGPETRFRSDLGVQSIDVVDFLFVLEKRMERRIDVEAFFQFLAKRESGSLRDILVGDVIAFLSTSG
ncbi:MAG: phosphopantetheine-binding protein [Oligoflexia bacterium]|nr:phosphopantetheine-binding protein [Oligoflexia bacterium]